VRSGEEVRFRVARGRSWVGGRCRLAVPAQRQERRNAHDEDQSGRRGYRDQGAAAIPLLRALDVLDDCVTRIPQV
jgi:hypothetical protein